jgi:hypothetical protein
MDRVPFSVMELQFVSIGILSHIRGRVWIAVLSGNIFEREMFEKVFGHASIAPSFQVVYNILLYDVFPLPSVICPNVLDYYLTALVISDVLGYEDPGCSAKDREGPEVGDRFNYLVGSTLYCDLMFPISGWTPLDCEIPSELLFRCESEGESDADKSFPILPMDRLVIVCERTRNNIPRLC